MYRKWNIWYSEVSLIKTRYIEILRVENIEKE